MYVGWIPDGAKMGLGLSSAAETQNLRFVVSRWNQRKSVQHDWIPDLWSSLVQKYLEMRFYLGVLRCSDHRKQDPCGHPLQISRTFLEAYGETLSDCLLGWGEPDCLLPWIYSFSWAYSYNQYQKPLLCSYCKWASFGHTEKAAHNSASATKLYPCTTATYFHIRGATTVASRNPPVCRSGQWGVLALSLVCPWTMIANRWNTITLRWTIFTVSHLVGFKLTSDILLNYWHDIGRNEVSLCDLSNVTGVPYIPWGWECV